MHVNDPAQPSIVGHYIQPPFSVLDRKKGEWQKRTRWWRDRLPDDAIGREATSNASTGIMSIGDGISRFDPTVAEIFYRWWTKPGDVVIDPFSGGPTRGLVAQAMGRNYHGIDIRPEQVAANRQHGDLWQVGDAITWRPPPADAIFTCPPYAHLERYSDDPRDLSTLDWPQFQGEYSVAIHKMVASLHDDRYIGIVISDIRDKTGMYLGLPDLTRQALRQAGCGILADMVILDPIGRKYLTGWKLLGQSRKPQRVHQHLIIGVKGKPSGAAERLQAWGMHITPNG